MGTAKKRPNAGRAARAAATAAAGITPAATGAKKSKTYRLTESKITAAREILGAATATAAIEAALDMVVFRKELVDGTAALLGVDVTPLDRG